MGNTDLSQASPINVFLETIRDYAAFLASIREPEDPVVTAADLRRRSVLHEAMHRFGHAAHDVAIMNYEIFATGTDEQNKLPGSLLREIIIRERP